MVKIAINGFGRIGRAALKIALEHEGAEVAAINDLGDLNNLAYLLRYDTVYGRYSREVKVEGDVLVVGKQRIKVCREPQPEKLPWKDLSVGVVIESTGFFTKEEEARKHLTAGAKKVVISAPTKSAGVVTVVTGVNDKEAEGQEIIANASCTTNCIAPVAAVMDEKFGIKKAMLTTAHAYTATQLIVDGPAGDDFRRGRAAGVNIVPSSTGAALATALVYKPLKDKFDGVALRVPVPVVSISDLVFLVKKKATVEEVQQAFVAAAASERYKGILGVTSEPVVSSDFIGDPRSAIVDLLMTRVVDGDMVKVMAWYDNEWGYANRLVEQAVAAGKES